jgi:hypothetical protein
LTHCKLKENSSIQVGGKLSLNLKESHPFTDSRRRTLRIYPWMYFPPKKESEGEIDSPSERASERERDREREREVSAEYH